MEKKFFIIQIASIIQFQMSNFLILKYIGAVEVTEYNIAYKYMSVIMMIWGITKSLAMENKLK